MMLCAWCVCRVVSGARGLKALPLTSAAPRSLPVPAPCTIELLSALNVAFAEAVGHGAQYVHDSWRTHGRTHATSTGEPGDRHGDVCFVDGLHTYDRMQACPVRADYVQYAPLCQSATRLCCTTSPTSV